MKNKIAIASAFIAASSFSAAEIVINDVLSFEGFVDMSYSSTDNDTTGSANSLNVDQVEVSWLFDFEPVTAQIDLQHSGGTTIPVGATVNGTAVEQAFATYSLEGGNALTAGLYASMLGFEAFEPTGLYQYSTAYSFFGTVVATPGYVQGVKYTNEGENTFFGFSVQDSAFGTAGAPGVATPGTFGGSGFGLEAAYAYNMENGLSFFVGGAYGDDDGVGTAAVGNFYATYETGAWLFAAEVNVFDRSLDTGADQDGVAGLLMANYAYSDAASVTARVSFFDDENAAVESEGVTLTLAHGYAFTDNLFLVTEVSSTNRETANVEQEILFGAVELLFTF